MKTNHLQKAYAENTTLGLKMGGKVDEIYGVKDVSSVERFWLGMNIKTDDECWEWKRGFNKKGYGIASVNGEQKGAHIHSFLLSGGVLTPEKPVVLHSCDNPSCCNPKHLSAGTIAENNLQAQQRNRIAKGKSHGRAKLDEADIKLIFELSKTHSQRKIAELMNQKVSYHAIGEVLRGRTWKHISEKL